MKGPKLKPKYTEIQKLFNYCIKKGINAELEPCYDGYKICFPNGSDFVQHRYSYGSEIGFIEPAIGCRLDYKIASLKQAKNLVKYHKDRLNRRTNNEKQIPKKTLA